MIRSLLDIGISLVVLSLIGCGQFDYTLDRKDTILRDDPCKVSFEQRIEVIMEKNHDFNPQHGIQFQFSFVCEDSLRLQKFNQVITKRVARDNIRFDRIWVNQVTDSLYRVQWYQTMGYDPNVYCEQFHYLNYMSQKYWLSRYSNLLGTIEIKP